MHKIWFGILGVIIAFCIYMQWISGAVGDKEWILHFAREWVSGKTLYSDLFSALPPLIFWLDAIPVAIAQLLHVPADSMLILFTFSLVAISIAVAVMLIRHASHYNRTEFALLLVFMFCVWSHALYFGDREHLFLVLILPYALRWMPSLSDVLLPLPLRIFIGCMAAIGFCIKPHCALVFVAIQLITIYQSRSWRIIGSVENAVIYVGSLNYLAAIAVFAPDYYNIVLPMSLATYSATSDYKAMLFYGMVSLLLLVVALADFRLRDRSPYRRDIMYFLTLCVGLLLYALSNNGWAYTWNPLNEIILLVTALIYWEHRAQTTEERRHRFGMRACSISFVVNTLAVLVLYGGSFFVECDASCKIDRDMKNAMEQKNARSFGSISINFSHPATLASETGAAWQTRFNHLWMLPKFFISDDAFKAKHQWIIDYVAQAYAQDLENNKPAIVFVDDTDMFYNIYHPVNLIAYLSADEAFRNAWSQYRFLSSIDYCNPSATQRKECKYDLYERLQP